MYSVIVPLNNKNFSRSDRSKTVESLKNANVNKVLLALDITVENEDAQNNIIATLKENMTFLKNQGFSCGVWLWAFAIKTPNSFTKMTGVNGKTDENECCPLDENFLKCQSGFIKKIAELSPELILFDDDLRFGNFSCVLGCLCEHHLKDIENRLCEKVTREFMRDKIIHGEKNKYRSAYVASLGDSLRIFCRKMREAVDEINPNIRIGQCACISSWDLEDASPYELVRILAGKTKPYLRLIGAPYWATGKYWGNRLGDIIDFERIEKTWCGDCENIEIVSEGDVYPRPRFATPASYLECFDAVLRATNNNNGIMKYMADYCSSPSMYENGYFALHNYDKVFLSKVEKQFYDKKAIGVNVVVKQRKFENMCLRDDTTEEFIQDNVFPISSRFATANSLTTVFNGIGEIGSQIIFGEDAKYIDKINIPTVIDLAAAEILSVNGFDVGIKQFNELIQPQEQYFEIFNEYTPCGFNIEAKNLILDEKTVILSYYICENKKVPAILTYTSKNGQQFFVMNFNAKYSNENIYRNYCLQELLTDFTKPLVYCLKNPDLYIYCAKSGNKVAVILANLFADKILAPEIRFNAMINENSFDFNNCSGKLKDGKLILSALGAFEFASFEFEIK